MGIAPVVTVDERGRGGGVGGRLLVWKGDDTVMYIPLGQ